MKIKTGDMVVVIAGKRQKSDYQGVPRKVLKVLPSQNKVVVEGHRVVKKHVRPSKDRPKGGRIEKEYPIDVSNVMLYCEHCERGVRVGSKFTAEGKIRVCRSCGKEVPLPKGMRPKRSKNLPVSAEKENSSSAQGEEKAEEGKE
ncbi:MAG: 50S ribosomal protein L24 [Planctomycetota bacterium]|nr:MAG: 50S ribosomal protein L24 [Planctomycetota bacterium]